MEPAEIRDDVDPDSAEYRRALIRVIFIVLGLGVIGGSCLGMKIADAEKAKSEQASQTEQTSDQSEAAPKK